MTAAGDYLDSIQAPAKDFVLLHGLGHRALFMQPDLIKAELITRVLPLATCAPAP